MLDKAIQSGKDRRKPYYKKAQIHDLTCRNHGSCEYCRNSRTYNFRRRKSAAEEEIKEWTEQRTMKGERMLDGSVYKYKMKTGDRVRIISKSIGSTMSQIYGNHCRIGSIKPALLKSGTIVKRCTSITALDIWNQKLPPGVKEYFVVAYDGYDEMIKAKTGDFYLTKDLVLESEFEFKEEFDGLFEI